MMIHDVTRAAGHRPRRKRVGRGESSGMGRTSGRGNKGAGARAGWGGRMLAEGGQMPIFRRIPKRGFSNFHFRTEFAVVNLSDLESSFSAGATVNAEALRKLRLLRGPDALLKVLGDGELTKKLSVEAHAFSQRAREAIEKAGGAVTVIPLRDAAALAKAKRKSAKNRKRPEAPSRVDKKKSARQAAR